jgi:LacI family transcriptional regulator
LFYDRQRLEAFSAALAWRGAACQEILPPDVPPRQRADLIRRWLRKVPKPVAVLGTHDQPAVELLAHCTEAGISVPGDVGVLGVGNDEVLCEQTDPPLSSIDQNATQIGYEAALLMARLLEGGPRPVGPILVVPRRLVVRESSTGAASLNAHLASVLDFIWEHAGRLRGVGDLCRRFQLSRRSLELLFEKHLGRSPAKEILHVRIERAKARLIDCDEPLKSIAGDLGFCNVSHFDRVFRGQTSMTAGAYRDQNRLR